MTERATVVPASPPVVCPRVAAVIGVIERRYAEIEETAVRIDSIDAEVPVAGIPVKRTIEVACSKVSLILPIEENVIEV